MYDFVITDPQAVFESSHAHNGIASLAAAWKSQGKTVRVIDYAKRDFPRDRHLRLVGKTAHFGVSVKTVTYDRSQQITKSFHAKALELGVRDATKILWGGAHVTERMETTDPTIKSLPWVFNEDTASAKERMLRENPEVDVFVPGEAEFWPENDEKRFDLDTLPFPDYTDFDSYENLVDGWRRGRLVWGTITSRGCPFLCNFCTVPRVSGRAWRHRSIGNCMEEITTAWSKYRFHMFEVVDDEFNVGRKKGVGPEHPKEFCKAVIERKESGALPKDLQWRCPNGLRADFYDLELNTLLKESGCGQVSFGCESLHPEVFKRVMKGETVEQVEATLRLCGENGMSFFAHTIIGLPGSSFETDIYTLNRLMDITDGSRLGFGTFSILQVMAGSPMAAIAMHEGYRDPSFVDYAFFGDNVKVTYWTDGYGKEERLDAYLITNYCMGNGRVPEFYKSWKGGDAADDLRARIQRHARELRAGLDENWWTRLGL